jgi:hypothetical protein
LSEAALGAKVANCGLLWLCWCVGCGFSVTNHSFSEDFAGQKTGHMHLSMSNGLGFSLDGAEKDKIGQTTAAGRETCMKKYEYTLS